MATLRSLLLSSAFAVGIALSTPALAADEAPAWAQQAGVKYLPASPYVNAYKTAQQAGLARKSPYDNAKLVARHQAKVQIQQQIAQPQQAVQQQVVQQPVAAQVTQPQAVQAQAVQTRSVYAQAMQAKGVQLPAAAQPAAPAPVALKPQAAPQQAAMQQPAQLASLAPAAKGAVPVQVAAPVPPAPKQSPKIEGPLTLETAIMRALKNSPERDVAAAQVGQAVAAVDEASSSYWPQVNLKYENGREYNFPYAIRAGATSRDGYNYGSNASVNVRQMLFDGMITRETVRQRLQLVESANLSREKVSEELIKFTTEAYMELRHFQQVLVASKENLDALREIARLIELRVQAGDASQIEQNYMKARLAVAEQNHVNAQASLTDAYDALTYLIGEVPEFDAIFPNLAQYEVADASQTVQKAIGNNTDMRLVSSDRIAANHELNAAEGRFYPTVDFVVDGNKSDDLGGDTGFNKKGSAKLQVGFKLFDGGLRRATVERQHAKIREIDAREDRVKREIRQSVSKAYNKRQSTIKELEIAENEIVANTDLEKLYRTQFEQGDIDITQLVESQERIYAAQVKKSRLESDMVLVTFDLLRTTADLLPKFCRGGTGC